jgi:hypothetical protein
MLEKENSSQQLPAEIDQNSTTTVGSQNQTARRVIVWAVIVAAALTTGIGAYPLFYALLKNDVWIDQILQQHFAATVGLPSVSALSFLVVVTFEARFEKIEMEFFGILKFKGASGPIVLWVFCVLALSACIRMLW